MLLINWVPLSNWPNPINYKKYIIQAVVFYDMDRQEPYQSMSRQPKMSESFLFFLFFHNYEISIIHKLILYIYFLFLLVYKKYECILRDFWHIIPNIKMRKHITYSSINFTGCSIERTLSSECVKAIQGRRSPRIHNFMIWYIANKCTNSRYTYIRFESKMQQN